MKLKITLILICINLMCFGLIAQLPLVYQKENTGAAFAPPIMPALDELPVTEQLTDPFLWANGKGRSTRFSDWEKRRNEIKSEIEHYEIGTKPARPEKITASFSAADSTLKVDIDVNGKTLTLTSKVSLPSGNGPFPVVIGMNSLNGSIPQDIFTSRNIARIRFVHNQVTTYNAPKNTDPYYQLYPELFGESGQYSAWSWGVSRIIDGLELVRKNLPVDLKKIAVTGCSYAGKMALFAGAFDERIALTIPQESGGGGAPAWRVSETAGKVEKLGSTSHQWFREGMFRFAGNNVYKLPYDHHELMAMIAPRALLVTGNTDFLWLSNEAAYVSSRATKEIYKTLGISDRMGFYIDGGHGHCAIPASQRPAIEAFVDKFLLGKTGINTDTVTIHPYPQVDYQKWYAWWGKTKPPVATRAQGNSTGPGTIIAETPGDNTFTLTAGSTPVAIYTDEKDDWLVQKSALLLQQDIEKVTGRKPLIIHTLKNATANVIAIGTLAGCRFARETLKSNLASLENKWDCYQIRTIKNPAVGISNMILVAGADKRGAAYGTLEISKQIGVSPWNWWADVPVKTRKEIYVRKDIRISDAPSVKYRGIFINDEAPAFSGWTREKFGGVNHNMYEHMFELLLRLKGNFLWPAMWGNAFNDDDTLNPVMADKWGIVMGTSHHEPMLRAQQEWKRYGTGAWDYTKNDSTLKKFWRQGIQHMGTHESIVTVGMRGDGDLPMTQGTATELLEKVVADQRNIIAEVTGKAAERTPQAWALYKEVQDYYDKGMRVPDDVTLLLCDDNWGNIRKLPKPADKPRSGGYGIYYHFDYVGGPRNYKWLNTNNVARVWEQMNLAYNSGVDRIWVVNVGDLKPMEFPISFFLDHAWNAKTWTDKMPDNYFTDWAAGQFGTELSIPIGNILRKYGQYSARVKPELLNANTYSIQNYQEWPRVVKEMNQLLAEAERAATKLQPGYHDAYFELVLHPVKALTNLHRMYYAVAMNRDLSQKKDLRANSYADTVKALYQEDSLLSKVYNKIAGGKWNHMMDQTHIGYTSWQEPRTNVMPSVRYVSADSANKVTQTSNIAGRQTALPYISLSAAGYVKAVDSKEISWKTIPAIGREGDGVSSFPVTKSVVHLTASGPHLEYAIDLPDTGLIKLQMYFSPTLPFNNEGLKYAISVDEEAPQIINLHKDYNERIWNQWVANNVILQTNSIRLSNAGKHTIKYWLLDAGIVLQKLVVNAGGVNPSFLGPPMIAVN